VVSGQLLGFILILYFKLFVIKVDLKNNRKNNSEITGDNRENNSEITVE
jgi:hypothetical protein